MGTKLITDPLQKSRNILKNAGMFLLMYIQNLALKNIYGGFHKI